MDNYEYNIKSDQIKKLYTKKDFSTAAKVADSIDWRRVKNNSMLNLVADVYDRCKEYEKARNVLLIAYDRTTCARQLAYKLTILSLRLKDFVEADEFYQDFVEMAPDDTAQYILKYRIAKTKGEDNDVLIQILEAYAEVEMDERWQYELAKLYDETGRRDKCVDMCDQVILWFSEGKYVEKAMELKMKYEPLTREQQEKYDNRQSLRNSVIEDTPAAVPVENSETGVNTRRFDTKEDILNTAFGTIPIIRDEMLDKKESDEDEINVEPEKPEVSEDTEKSMNTDSEPETEEPEKPEERDIAEARQAKEEETKQLDKEMYGNKNTIEFYDFTDVRNDKMSKIGEDLMKTAEIDIDEINFRAMSVSEYDTANIQAAIAKSMEIIMKESNKETRFEDEPEEEKPLEDNKVSAETGKTKRIDTEEIKQMMGIEHSDSEENEVSADAFNTVNVRSAFDQPSEEEVRREAKIHEARINIMKEHLDREKAEVKYHTVPLSPLFEQEEDGQIMISEPEESDEQIEGQMTIEEVLHEIEIRQKYEAALAEVAKYEEEIRKQEERKRAREAVLVLEESEIEPAAEEDALSDDNFEPVQIEETGESDWMEQSEEETNEEKDVDEQSDLVKAMFGDDTEVVVTPPDIIEDTTEEDNDPLEDYEHAHISVKDAMLVAGLTPAVEVAEELTAGLEDDVSDIVEESENNEVIDAIEDIEEEKQAATELEEVAPEVAVTEDRQINKVVVQNRDEEELGKLRLNDEYRAVFADFLDVPGLEEQLVSTIDHLINEFEMDGTSKSNNVLIMGDTKTGKTTLALGIIKVANRGRGHGRPGRKVAKIKAEVLNKKGVTSAMPKILGADLVIEKAGNLTPTTVVDLIEVMKTYTEEMLIVMEDDQAALERLMNTNPEVKKVFNNHIYIKGYDADDYVRMAKDYAAKRRYVVNEMGTLALYARIGDIFGRNQCVTREELEDIIDEAIDHAERGGIKKFIGRMKRNKEEFGILKEEDFV